MARTWLIATVALPTFGFGTWLVGLMIADAAVHFASSLILRGVLADA